MATAAASTRTERPAPRGEGRGRVLAAAFDEAERQPALLESRGQALELVARGAPPHDVASVVEADVGLTCAVVRAAGQLQGGARIRSVPDAVERLGRGAVGAVLVGGVLTRRGGCTRGSPRRSSGITSKQAESLAAVTRFADMVAAHIEDCPVSTEDILDAGNSCALDEQGVRRVLYELPQGKGARRRASGPCPLSARELDVLRRLAEGKVYKQIAQEWSSRRGRCGAICTTSTASSALSTERKPF